ncbi:hypothetical protein [Actinocatenispora rupis]|uniref:Uncharacterized protein n=1 Tax=Actinocatenispora rupis TaxID=519421 RepID=A0A8J3IZ08_9ACTN|nr:hypothetical protein [Actinocatenispora rupis]GID11415.1 hypothetical protein Aru02nite_23040 [Actinocatenispora rupis]
MPTRVTRWSMLAVLLAFGVALMHTLGHPATGHDGMAGMSTHRAVDGLFEASYPVGLPASVAGSGAPDAMSTAEPGSVVSQAMRGGPSLALRYGSPATVHDARPAHTGIVRAAQLADGVPGTAVHGPAPGSHGMDPSLMCLAILTALLALAVTAAGLLRRTRTARPVVPLSYAGGRSRAPPPSPVGHLLATTSVLRV